MGDAIIIFFFSSSPIYIQAFSKVNRTTLANHLNKFFLHWDIKSQATNEDQIALMNSILQINNNNEYLFRLIPQFEGMSALAYSSNVFGIRVENKQIQLSYICPTGNSSIELDDPRNDIATKINDTNSILEMLQSGFHAWKPGKAGLWLCAKKEDN